ncbi:conserved hypothetical protein [Nostocoides australiense Ben110]|uniref:Transcriptional regulatory protein n=2 Tax=Nostocoides australiense TaxID=99480 RepID=W6K1T6_9MICO|nr:conserved hypothetical protein [Tetrasphaera australiensis Ben110]
MLTSSTRSKASRSLAPRPIGTEALTLVEDLAPDLLLLDVHLPDMTGVDVLFELRSRHNPVDVIMVTAERDVAFVQRALRGGASHYLIKPFEISDLSARLRDFARSVESIGHGALSQESVDAAFRRQAPTRATPRSTLPPKGLSRESLDLVIGALRSGEEMSAAECAERVGMARVSVRRYLEHLVSTGQATVRPMYGSGRPVHLFRWVGPG